MFQIVYSIQRGSLECYIGNYTTFSGRSQLGTNGGVSSFQQSTPGHKNVSSYLACRDECGRGAVGIELLSKERACGGQWVAGMSVVICGFSKFGIKSWCFVKMLARTAAQQYSAQCWKRPSHWRHLARVRFSWIIRHVAGVKTLKRCRGLSSILER